MRIVIFKNVSQMWKEEKRRVDDNESPLILITEQTPE